MTTQREALEQVGESLAGLADAIWTLAKAAPDVTVASAAAPAPTQAARPAALAGERPEVVAVVPAASQRQPAPAPTPVQPGPSFTAPPPHPAPPAQAPASTVPPMAPPPVGRGPQQSQMRPPLPGGKSGPGWYQPVPARYRPPQPHQPAADGGHGLTVILPDPDTTAPASPAPASLAVPPSTAPAATPASSEDLRIVFPTSDSKPASHRAGDTSIPKLFPHSPVTPAKPEKPFDRYDNTRPDPEPEQADPRPPRRKVSVAEVFSLVGSAITLLGVVFVMVMPQDGIVGPLARTIIAAVLAVGAVATAWRQHAKDPRNIGAQALMATGVASAFLCLIADTVLFVTPDGISMLPRIPGMILAGLVSLGGVWIAKRWNSEWLAVLAILGSLLLAPALARPDDFVWCLAFMVVMTVVTAAFQRGLTWLWLMAARILPTSVVFLWVAARASVTPLTPAAVAVILAAVLALAGLGTGVVHQRASHAEQLSAVTYMGVMAGPLMIMSWRGDQLLAALVTLTVGLILSAVGLSASRFTPMLRSAAVPLGAMFVGFGALRMTGGQYGEFLYFGLAAVYLAVARSTRFKPVLAIGCIFSGFGLVHWIPMLPTPSSVYLAAGHGFPRVVESALGLAVVLFLVRALRVFLRRGGRLTYEAWAGSLIFGTVAMVLAGTSIGEAAGNPAVGFQSAHAAVTISWLVLCVIQLKLGLRRDPDARTAVNIAVALAAGAVAKLFLFDLANLPGMVRAIAFLGVGVLLLSIGTWYAKQLERVRKTVQPAPEHPATDGEPDDKKVDAAARS